MKHLYLLLLLLSASATAQQWRVSEDIFRYWDGNAFITLDSTKYTYRYDRDWGSSPMNDTIRYYKRRQYRVANGSIELREDFLQKFYNDGEILATERQGLDTLSKEWKVWGIDSFTKTGKWLQEYKGYELLHQGGSAYAMYPTRRQVNDYNTLAGLLMGTMYQKSYAFSYQWTNDKMNRYGYDTAGRLMVDTLYYTTTNSAWQLHERNVYTYNSAGQNDFRYDLLFNKQTSNWDSFLRYRYTYNVQGQRDSAIMEFYGMGQWAPLMVNTYTYHPSGRVATDSSFSVGSANPYVKAHRYTFGTHGHLTEWLEESYNLYRQQHVYTYELYWPAGVEKVAQYDLLKLFPVPASGVLNIAARLQDAGPVQMSITDMQGHIVLQFSAQAKEEFSYRLPIAHLPPGHYIFSLRPNQKTMPLSQGFVVTD